MFLHRLYKIAVFQFNIIFYRIYFVELLRIYFVVFSQEGFFAGNGPDIVQWRLENGGLSCDEHGAAIRLHTHRGAIASMDVYLAIYARLLRIAHDDIGHRAIFETQNSHGCIFHFDIRVIDILPHTIQFFKLAAHIPLQQVKLVRGLVYQYAATLFFPTAAPGIARIILFIAPAIHHYHAQHRRADLAAIDRFFYTAAAGIKSALAHHTQFQSAAEGHIGHGITIFECNSQWFFYQYVSAIVHGLHGGGLVRGMRRAYNGYVYPL